MKQFLLCVTTFSVLSFAASAQTPCENGFADIYPCENVDFLSFMSLDEIGGGDNTNDIWGWVSPDGKEYAIVGCSNGTAFIDITDAANPVYIGIMPTHNSNSLWRDMETYGHYCFSVNEANFHGLQVFDMNHLAEVTNPPVMFEEDAHYPGFGHCHTLAINQESGFLYANGTSSFDGGLHIVDINDPLLPVLAGGYELDGYTHDSYAMNYNGPDPDYIGHEIVMACNEDALTVVDVTDKSDCQTVSINEYFNTGYTHQGWFTEDDRYFLVNDELDEMYIGLTMRTHIFDCLDLDNIQYLGFFDFGFDNIDHNLYIKDQYVYEANYRSGLRILDATNVADANLTEVGYFDIHPQNNGLEFEGSWSVYPYLPSGNILVSDMYDGFYVVKFNAPVSVTENVSEANKLSIQPNPACGNVSISMNESLENITISDITGKVVFELKNISFSRFNLNVNQFEAGVYLITAGEQKSVSRLIIE